MGLREEKKAVKQRVLMTVEYLTSMRSSSPLNHWCASFWVTSVFFWGSLIFLLCRYLDISDGLMASRMGLTMALEKNRVKVFWTSPFCTGSSLMYLWTISSTSAVFTSRLIDSLSAIARHTWVTVGNLYLLLRKFINSIRIKFIITTNTEPIHDKKNTFALSLSIELYYIFYS